MTIRQFAWRFCGIISALTACLFGSVTYAMFTDDAPVQGVVVAGDLNIALGKLTWNIPTLGASGSGAESLAAVFLGDGDQLVVDQQIEATFIGNNLDVAMMVTWTSLPSGAVAGWVITDANQQQIVPASGAAELGEKVSSSGLLVGGTASWHLIITVTMPADLSHYVDPTLPPPASDLPLGIITVTANQVRG